ncbi:AraC family transcriptional regulator [Flavobacterium sp. 7A]|uniref:AraC family transcriptional regulator n=1 Tax=Flavobacterium sp. 7A TaxID=2940571 RepID=UPI0022277B89|nr:helix-turn-helix transcriptional regulator [Flavobacterium sp. 7A]MCW2118861.1 AraC-like DNA-binding protein [Flavobacterium sp. 7A]
MNNDYQTYTVLDYGFQINPLLPVIGYSEDISEAVCLTHSHPRGQLLYATTGVMKVIVNNQIWFVNPLQAIWIPGGAEHQVYFQMNVGLYSAFIDPSCASRLPKKSCAFDISILLKELLFKIILFERENIFALNQEKVVAVFLDELSLIVPSETFLPMSNHVILNKILNLLIQNMASKQGIEYYAALACVSSRTLSRIFIKELGMNFSDWCIRLKVLEAIKMLGEKQSVKEIALDLGYENTSAFIHMFKKNTGKTPATFIT